MIAAEFWLGNNSGGKQTLDRDYLERAEMTGHVKIAPLQQVTSITETPAGGYTVTCDNITENRRRRRPPHSDVRSPVPGGWVPGYHTALDARPRPAAVYQTLTSTSATASAMMVTCS